MPQGCPSLSVPNTTLPSPITPELDFIAPTTAPSAPFGRCASPWWRVLSVTLALALLLGWATSASMVEQLKAQIKHLQAKVTLLPQVRHIAVLLNSTQQLGLLATLDPGVGVLQLQQINPVNEKSGQSLQLWALQEGKPPRSLGLVISEYKTLQLPVQAEALADIVQLAVSIEDKGGVPDIQGPKLPYALIGWLVQKSI